jgi:hypothetical protein
MLWMRGALQMLLMRRAVVDVLVSEAGPLSSHLLQHSRVDHGACCTSGEIRAQRCTADLRVRWFMLAERPMFQTLERMSGNPQECCQLRQQSSNVCATPMSLS